MIQQGYEGEYPHFRKMSSLKGIRLMEINGQPVIVCNEKNMACIIDCYERSLDSNIPEILFVTSTCF